MKKIFLILVVLLMFSVSNSLAQDAIKPHRIKNFFPKGEALLDGYLVDYSQWKRYSAFNKALFIKEYIMELEDEFNVVIKFRRWGLGPFDKYIDEKIKKEEDKIIVYNFIREFLKEQCAFPSTESGCDDLYKYDTNDVPEVFFFPISLSRWDGTKIDVMSWGKLDSLLKEKFMLEYSKVLEIKYDTTIKFDKYVYLAILDGMAKEPDAMWMTDLFERALKEDDIIKEKGEKE